MESRDNSIKNRESNQQFCVSFQHHHDFRTDEICSRSHDFGANSHSSTIFHSDSGYSSHICTPSCTLSNASPLLCSTSVSTPQKYNEQPSDLSNPESSTRATIKPDVKLTPVTQNIRRICEFHITTPKSSDISSSNKLKRSCSVELSFDAYPNTPKKSRLNDGTSQIKTPLKSGKIKDKRTIRKIRSAIDFDTDSFGENSENISNEIELTPIFNREEREKRTPLSTSKLVNIQASTPKSSTKVDGHEINLNRTSSIRRLLSFSGKNSKLSTVIESPDENNFGDQLLKGSSIREKVTSEKRSKIASKFTKRHSFDDYQKFIKRSSFQRGIDAISNNIDLTFKRTPTSANTQKFLDEHPTVELKFITPPKRPLSDVITTSVDLQTPTTPKKKRLSRILSFESQQDKEIVQEENIPVIAIQTPQRTSPPKNVLQTNFSESIKPSTSTSPKKSPSPKGSPVYETNEILYPQIPTTPPKKHVTSSLKRRLSTTLKKVQKKSRRPTYHGLTHLNIIGKLESYEVVLDRIFELLSSQDLVNLTLVSKQLNRIVYSNQKARARVSEFKEKCELFKENLVGEKVIQKKHIESVEDDKKSGLARLAFKICNKVEKQDEQNERSPPVSPSKRKFHDNQKIVKTLAENEGLTKCPRCAKSSRIIMSPVDNINPDITNDISTIRKFSICNIPNIPTSLSQNENVKQINSKTKVKLPKSLSMDFANLPSYKKSIITSPDFKPFGECTGLVCRYRFCLDCLCEYHPGSPCRVTKWNSPCKEEIPTGKVNCREKSPELIQPSLRQSKSRHKSLKRLCF